MRAEVTVPPHVEDLGEIASHPIVDGLRLNTVMPALDGREVALDRLEATGLPVWVDLKARQLRVAEAAVPPWTALRLSHSIRVETPCDVYLSAGLEHARLVAVDGDRIVLEGGPRRLIGPGESIHVIHPSLEIEGLLTDEDLRWIDVLKGRDEARILLSWVESADDVAEIRRRLPHAEIRCKIESRRGLAFAREHGARHGRLVAARGDLYVEAGRPHRLPTAVREILLADPEAIVASRIAESLLAHPVPSSADVSDLAQLLEWGVRRFLLGDAVCVVRPALMAALELLRALAAERT